MAKKVNKYYQKVAETPDATIQLGKINNDNVNSAFKVTCSEEGAQIAPHYFQMDKSGAIPQVGRKGGTILRGGGTFSVKHGDYVGDGIPGVYIDSGNGDLVLTSEGRIRIEAQDIDIIATGSAQRGNVQINASSKILMDSKQTIAMNAVSNINIFSSIALFLEGNSNVAIIGKDIEQISGATVIKGSTGIIPGLGTIEELKNGIRSLMI